MKRRVKRKVDEDAFATDSFLDVVSNIVGILIILVMVVGVRAKDVVIHAEQPTQTEPDDLSKARSQARSMTNDALRLAGQVDQLRATRLNSTLERDQLAVLTAHLDKKLAKQRESLDAEAQQQFELQQSLNTALDEQRNLQSRISRAQSVTEQTITIETYGTAISRTVNGTEIHFQLKGGRITRVPFDKLIKAVKDVWQDQIWKLRAQNKVKETLGPIDGFRVRYTIVRGEVSLEAQLAGAAAGQVYQIDQWELLPISSEIGEEVARALQDNSTFHALLREHHPRRTTITLWTYPEAFSDYQKIKVHLHELGYAAAGRPLSAGQLIGASPRGTKSSAQ